MKLTVLHVAYPLTKVGEDAVGGSEQVLTLLDRGLTEAGHHSIVIAAQGSRVRGTLIASPAARGLVDVETRKSSAELHKRLLRDTLLTYPVDLVHMHGLDFDKYLPDPGTPTLATLHLPIDWYPREIFQLNRSHFYLNCVSLSQQKTCPPSKLLIPSIRNGVDVSRLHGRARKRNHVLALGRICPEKGFHFALTAAKKAGVDLVLAGEVSPYPHLLEYFEKEIVSRLDKRRRFIGAVGFEAKKRLLLQAKCLLIPSIVQETSSLVAMEALAAGTPVIAFSAGALPEIVEHGKTGYLVSNAAEMADAIHAVDKLDPELCKRTALRRFSSEKMVERYFEQYRRIISRKEAQRQPVMAVASSSWLVG